MDMHRPVGQGHPVNLDGAAYQGMVYILFGYSPDGIRGDLRDGRGPFRCILSDVLLEHLKGGAALHPFNIELTFQSQVLYALIM